MFLNRRWELRNCPPAWHGYRGGGDSSSSSSSTTTTVDKRQVVDGGIGVTSDSSTVYVSATDQNAFNRAVDFATSAAEKNAETLKASVDFATNAAAKNAETLKSSLDKVTALASSASDDNLSAFSGVIDLAKRTTETNAEAYEQLLTTTRFLAQTTIDTLGESNRLSQEIAKQPGQNADPQRTLIYAGLAVVGVLAVKSFGKH